MLPVYQAISFQRIIEKGGRSNPWLIVVDTGEGYKPYVVKLFETRYIDSSDCVAKEVIGNVLAKEFDLNAPNAALIDMDEDFYNTIRNQQIIEILESKDLRIKFGTEQLEGVIPFDKKVFSISEAKEMIDIDTLFAFDCLIRNTDRSNINPNLLVKRQQAFLIDHEVSLDIDEKTGDEVLGWYLPDKCFRYHIFFDYIKNSIHRQKGEYFDTFEEYLRMLNINKLKSYLEQLSTYGFSSKNHNLIVDYLTKLKHNSSIFVNILKGLI